MVWMDANESEKGLRKQLSVETVRPPLLPSERSNGVAAHRARIRVVSSRYLSTSISTPPAVKRCPSPVSRSTSTPAPVGIPKRAVSAERKRPSTPTSPSSRPSTPVRDISVSLAARKLALTKQPEGLWPSTMRSLGVSFQSDGPMSTAKKERPVTPTLADRSLRLPSNASIKRPESPPSARKATPERRRSPLKGKSLLDQAENAKPVDSTHSRLVDPHRWPSRIGGKISSVSLSRSVDFTDKIVRNPPASFATIGVPSLRRLSDGSRPIQKTSNNVTNQISSDSKPLERKALETDSSSGLNNLLSRLPDLRKPAPLSSSHRTGSFAPVYRSQSLPGSRHPSPIRNSVQSRVPSQSHSRPATPPRGLSPSQIRPPSSSGQSSMSTSVLSFVADFRKPKKSNQLEDAHQLRLLYNRHLQWRFANARADVALRIQTVTAEKTLNNVRRTNLDLWDSVIKKKICLQQMRLELKLNGILNEQLSFLDDWASFEKEHSLSLSGAIKDLEASTLRLPVTGGARADIDSLKVAIGSAMDVMQSMGPSVCTLLPMAEGMNNLGLGLANLALQERAMLDECEAMLAMNTAMQVEENSLRTHLIQTYTSIDRY